VDSLRELGTAEDSPCRDEECDGTAEVEVDGDHRFRVCQKCGFEFGYEKIETTGETHACGIGVPESIRRAASAGLEGAIRSEAAKQPVPVQIGFGPPRS
jgi:hypothetical protein